MSLRPPTIEPTTCPMRMGKREARGGSDGGQGGSEGGQREAREGKREARGTSEGRKAEHLHHAPPAAHDRADDLRNGTQHGVHTHAARPDRGTALGVRKVPISIPAAHRCIDPGRPSVHPVLKGIPPQDYIQIE